MKKIILLIFCSFITSGILAQCSETTVTRVLLVGDSWANMIGTDNAIKNAFNRFGHSNYTFYTNAVIAENGTTTTDFLSANRLSEIETQLLAHPDIDFVHLSLGGNDALNSWHKSWSQSRTDSLLDSIYSRLLQIISFIENVKPGIKILWSGYCYPNFAEIIDAMAPFQSLHPFYSTWNAMGQPSFLEINSMLNYFSQKMDTMVANNPNVNFVKASALMQYIYGQTSPLGVPPGGTYAPLSIVMPEGLTDYPSPKVSMRSYVIATDCFHLKPEAFNFFLDFQTRKYYQKQLMDDQYLLSNGGTEDGAVSNLGDVTNEIKLGNNGNEQYAAILSFNTTLLPDTGVSKASIFLRRENLAGNNPVDSTMLIKVISGNFGSSVNVEATDLTASFDASDMPCQFGSKNANGNWIRLELPLSILPFIRHTSITQFMIVATDTSGLITFSNASDAEQAPILNITYGPQLVSVNEPYSGTSLSVFPNPVSDILYFKHPLNSDYRVELTDLSGRLLIHDSNVNQLPVSKLTKGTYLLRIITGTDTSVSKIIKH
ncbi:MAG: T9SS type A sorting domain-containing protein [Bacteroidia bacterium]|nr:T9SS type A sorting domain-containing protein [Bacteroidia bacterium]MCZ2277438.1 T9SS type A sorting domain-containing protein [Bacteroidia bacterium]